MKKPEYKLEKTQASPVMGSENLWGNDIYESETMGNDFPDGFFFGGGLSANQSEGAYDADGKGLSNTDIIPTGDKRAAILAGETDNLNGQIGNVFPARTAIDFYHNYKADLKLMADMGLNSFKINISWTRIFPSGEENEPNEKGLEFYDDVLDTCLSLGIEPIIVLNHYDQPLALNIRYGGWKNRKVMELFIYYAQTVVKRYINKVKYWIPVHEIDVLTNYTYLVTGMVRNEDNAWGQDKASAAHHMMTASARINKFIKELRVDAVVGTMVGITVSYPYTCDPEDVLGTILQRRMMGLFFADVQVNGYYPGYALKFFKRKGINIPFCDDDREVLRNHTADFLMFPYYNSTLVKAGEEVMVDNPYLGNETDPTGLRILINQLSERYGNKTRLMIGELALKTFDKPENGMVDDSDRIAFLQQHLKAIKEAILLDGADVAGCMLWEPIDCISVGKGTMSSRYGLVYVDLDDEFTGTMERIPKESYYWFKSLMSDKARNI